MSGQQGALRFADPLGPRGRRRVLVATVVAALAIVAVLYVAASRFAERGQFAAKLWTPFASSEGVNVYTVALGNTLKAAALAMVLATAFGILLAVGRLVGARWLRTAVIAWVEFFRGIPLVLLIIFLFFGLPRVGFDPGTYWFLVMGLTLYNSAVIAEIVRAGVLSLDRGQAEAGRAIGLTEAANLRLVVLPQALRRMIPALVSQMVVILKDTSLGAVISYPELLRRAQLAGSSEQAPLQALLIAAAIYLIVNSLLSYAARVLERRQGRVRKAARAGEIHVQGVEDLTI
jgi:glutamate transport system permease protein